MRKEFNSRSWFSRVYSMFILCVQMRKHWNNRLGKRIERKSWMLQQNRKVTKKMLSVAGKLNCYSWSKWVSVVSSCFFATIFFNCMKFFWSIWWKLLMWVCNNWFKVFVMMAERKANIESWLVPSYSHTIALHCQRVWFLLLSSVSRGCDFDSIVLFIHSFMHSIPFKIESNSSFSHHSKDILMI